MKQSVANLKSPKVVREYSIVNLGGFARLKFLENGDIILIDESPLLKSQKSTYMNGYENLFEFLTRNMLKYSRDELLYQIKKDINKDPKEIFVPFHWNEEIKEKEACNKVKV
ncbi:MAG: hypothetical protein ACTSRZ_14945 [Promethearchaeota archaeon]